MNKVAVYGSLKQGYGNHGVMQRAGGQLVSTEVIHGFNMYSLGGFPGIKPGNGSIHIEVYTVEDMQPLDYLEGYNPNNPMGGLYNRTTIQTSTGAAWIYIYNGHVSASSLIADGVW